MSYVDDVLMPRLLEIVQHGGRRHRSSPAALARRLEKLGDPVGAAVVLRMPTHDFRLLVAWARQPTGRGPGWRSL